MTSRLPSLRLQDLDTEARAARDEYATGTVTKGVVNDDTGLTAIAGVLLHNPGEYRGLMMSAESLLRSSGITVRDRQVIQLRIAWLCQAVVMWSNHTGHAHDAGMTEADVERVTQGPDTEGWNPHERALLRLADELHESATVSDATWDQLAEHFDVPQLVSLPMLVGYHHQLCYVFNALGVPEPDPARGGLAAR